MEWWGDLSSKSMLVLAAAIISIPVFLIFITGRDRETAPDRQGWTPVKPALLLRLIGVFGLASAAASLGIAGWIVWHVEGLLLILGGVIGSLFLAWVLLSAFHRYVLLHITFNDEGVQFRKLWTRQFWPWAEIGASGYSGRVGAYFIREGRVLQVPDLFRGYSQLLTMALTQGVPLHPYLKSQLEPRR